MKSQLIKYVIGVGVLASGLFFFQNCAPTNFAAQQPTEIVDKNICDPNDAKCLANNATPTPAPTGTPGNPGATPTPGTTPTPGATPTPTNYVYPKMTLETPACNANSMCPVTFKLDKAQTKDLSFNWKTHDTKYTENPQVYGEPGKHYVATSGMLTFAAGETSKVIYIQSLNINMNIRIPFQWWDCKFGGMPLSCQALQ